MNNKKYRKLIARIVEVYGSRKAFAEAYGISITAMSKKLLGKMGITTTDIIAWAKMLHIAKHEIPEYFYPDMEEEEQ